MSHCRRRWVGAPGRRGGAQSGIPLLVRRGCGAGDGLTGALAGAGAGSTNTSDVDVLAYSDSNTTITAGGNVQIQSTDTSTITADAGGVAISVARGGVGGSLSIGASRSNNTITTVVNAYAKNTNIDATGNLAITASSTATIDALAIAGSLAGVSAEGLAVSGAGSGSLNCDSWVICI